MVFNIVTKVIGVQYKRGQMAAFINKKATK